MVQSLNQTVHTSNGPFFQLHCSYPLWSIPSISNCSYIIWSISSIKLFIPHMVQHLNVHTLYGPVFKSLLISHMIHYLNQTVHTPYGSLLESDCSYPIWFIARIRLFVPHMVHCSNQTVRTPYGPLLESDCSYPIWSTT